MKLRRTSPVVALCISDVHLSLRPPIARAEEKDWLGVMGRVFQEVKDLSAKHRAPVICAGDLFDRWNNAPELINWALEHLPRMYGIPGNHDLPSHRPELEHQSSYGVLVRADKIVDLSDKYVLHRLPQGRVIFYGTSLNGKAPEPKTCKEGPALQVLLTHQYIWVEGASYPGAPEGAKLGEKSFRDFDVVVVGDNHIAFDRTLKGGTRVMNCGTLLRRKSNEVDYRPRVGLIHADGSTSSHLLDIEEDVISEVVHEDEEELDVEINNFIDALRSGADSLDFREAIHRAIRDKEVTRTVRELLLEALGDGKAE